MGADPPLREHLVLAGGGHSHALVLRQWAMRPERRPAAWITLVSRGSTALYSGLVPALIAGLVPREACAIDLRRLCNQAGVQFIAAEITGLELGSKQLVLAGRPPLRFDWLSLDVGAETAPCSAAGGLALGVKPLEPLLQWCEQAAPGAVQIIGSGAAAVEVALALQARGHAVALQTKAGGLALGSDRANRLLQRLLLQAGIGINTADRPAAATEPDHGGLSLACTGSRGPAWLAASGLPTDPSGRVQCQASLAVVGQPQLFVSGDCGVVAQAPRPASGVWAVRAAPVLAANLQRAIARRPLRRWRPQGRALQLLGDAGVEGQPRAIALWGPLTLGPWPWLWRWKQRIDARFMARFQQRQAMGAQSTGAGAGAMACRGCAAKLGAAQLQTALRALQELAPTPEPAEASALVDDDAAIVASTANGDRLLQSVDGFPALVSDPWLNARLTTLHACSDLWACGARVTSVQAVVTLPQLEPRLQSELLLQTLAGVRSVLDPVGAQLLGGHTLEARDAAVGQGFSLALSVNGTAPAQRCWAKGPLRPGDALILLRPLGTGVLFAAAMAGAAQPQWLDQALAVMQQSQAPAVDLLAQHGCRACTDITGFGLLGHLGEMLHAGGAAHSRVRLDGGALSQLALPGALELLADGHASTLAPANALALGLLEDAIELTACSAAVPQLLIDPQTCGPLLAAVPVALAPAAVNALQRNGFEQAAVIGRVG
ncbi:MAG: selenide, water dikinase SelD [Cyanobacteria bacterium K_DeepCast_35m_m2_023]|nr:selenide, water dikinase SelD [Cyanobacteria bacterium K_DeepCast_35m_m2_023]